MKRHFMNIRKNLLNKDLRLKIIETIINAKEGHIPSSLSIVDIINFLYEKKIKIKSPNDDKRDIFILSKGHGAMALYVVLNKFGFLSNTELKKYGDSKSALGGHPDMTKIKYVEASTGSLGHGFCTAVGSALALKIKNKKNTVYCLTGDGECHEGTIWEAANIATNNKLNNLLNIVDVNDSAKQLMPIDNLGLKWKAFGWNVLRCNGHSNSSLNQAFRKFKNFKNRKPTVILAKTTKGMGIPFMEGHGKWHHKIPNEEEFTKIKKLLGFNEKN